jgi:hypothetical protein
MAQSRKNSGVKTPDSQIRFIRRKWRENYSTQEIVDELAKKYGDKARSLRTVQAILKDIRENRIPWVRPNTNGTDARLIFNVLESVIWASEGRKLTFTADEAEWVAWVAKASPGLPPYEIWCLAAMYLNEEVQKKPNMAPMDAFLALRPWESEESKRLYTEATMRGVVPYIDYPLVDTAIDWDMWHHRQNEMAQEFYEKELKSREEPEHRP